MQSGGPSALSHTTPASLIPDGKWKITISSSPSLPGLASWEGRELLAHQKTPGELRHAGQKDIPIGTTPCDIC